jgi:hypothetical protein
MAVVESERGETKMAWWKSITKLNAYTITAVTNEKVIPKRYRWVVAQRLLDSSMSMLENAIKANSVYVKEEFKKSDYELRRKFQKLAYAETHTMLTLVDIAYKTFKEMTEHKVKTWIGLILSAQTDLKNWIENDSKRYG